MISKILPGNITVLLVPAVEIAGVPNFCGPTTLVPYTAPTTAVLNRWATVVSNASAGSGAGGNISGALRDDLKLGLTASSTDKDRTIISTGLSEGLTFFNFDAVMHIFRDLSLTDTSSVYNMANDLVRSADIPYLIVLRVGQLNTTPFVVGDEVDVFYAWTDTPVPVYTDGGNQLTNQTFIPKNVVNPSYTLPA